jgi:hypothetical protein
MDKKKIIWALVTIAVVVLVGASATSRAATIVKSKSNVSNNRLLVISSSPDLPERGNLVLMDQNTGELWLYPAKALIGQQPPKYLGTVVTLGESVVIEGRYNQPTNPR